MTRCRVAIAVVSLGVVAAGPACAEEALAPVDTVPSWRLGSLAFSNSVPTDRSETIGDMQQKYRLGAAPLPGLEPYAALKPWVAGNKQPDGTVTSRGGVLLDVPVGSFLFTPSVGAGYVANSPRENRGTIEFRSQVELGYQFENRSRVTLGYSRITGGPAADSRTETNNVVGFTYRLPFGALLGQ
ncbi:hypothetical protein [Azospirillum sp. sgz301742]